MPVIPDPHTPPVSGPGLIWSQLSSLVSVTVPFTQWWLVVPEQLDLSIPLSRVASGATASAGNLPTSYAPTQTIPEGVFHAFGRKNALITRGDLQGEELDVNLLFQGEAAYANFVAVWESGLTALLQSDQLKQWYADLGSTRTSAVARAADRRQNPVYIVALHVISADAP